MRHTHTSAENFMLANAFLDVVEGLMTLEEAKAYLSAHYEHHPSPSSVSSYLEAARSCYESLQPRGPRGPKTSKPKPARNGAAKARSGADGRSRYSSDLSFQMRLAVDQRAGD
jgi:hypothetical protein